MARGVILAAAFWMERRRALKESTEEEARVIEAET